MKKGVLFVGLGLILVSIMIQGSVSAWDNLAGGDHGGQDWIISSNTEIAGNHINIRNFKINSGIIAIVKPFNGANYGSVEIHAQNINITGTLDASRAGYGGGGGGGGGAGNFDSSGDPSLATGGTGGAGISGGLNGIIGSIYNGLPGKGGDGGGTFGGLGGTVYECNCNNYFANGNPGGNGGYRVIGGQGDTSTDESLRRGSGGGGGTGGYAERGYMAWCVGGGGGGGAGNRGAGFIKLYATNLIVVPATGSILAKGKSASTGNGANGFEISGGCDIGGNGGNGGDAFTAGTSAGGIGGTSSCSCKDSCTEGKDCGNQKAGDGGTGGTGAGGGILLYAFNINVAGTIDNRGGSSSTTNGGTLKIFCGSGGKTINTADLQSTTGRLYMSDECGQIVSVNATYWANLRNINQNISSSNLGDTVLMTVPGAGLQNKIINYTVKEKNSLFGIDWLWPDSKVSQSSTLGFSTWAANISGIFYFIARVSDVANQSNDLNVSSAGNNSAPVAIITNPNGSDFRFSTDCIVNFTQASYDEDDLLRLTWNFGDGVVANSTQNYSLALTPNIADTQHFYSLPGVYTVSLTAAEMARNQSDMDYTTVHILREGLNAVPVITLPENRVAYGNWVDFNANQSYVANCSLNMPGYNFTACNLQCKYIHAPGTRNTGASYNLRMNWTVRDSLRNIELQKSGDWDINYTTVVEFDEFFANPGQHNAVLDMEYL